MKKYLIKRTNGTTERTYKDKNFTLLNKSCKLVTEQISTFVFQKVTLDCVGSDL